MKLLLTGAFCALIQIFSYGTDLNSGLRFYAPFEDDCAPAVAKGSDFSSTPNAEFAAGKNGQAVKLSKTLNYIIAGNIKADCGTVAFWHKPDWSPDAKSISSRTFFEAVHVACKFQPRLQRAFFMTGLTRPQKGFKWDYGCYWNGMRNFKPGVWQHIAFTWDSKSRKKVFYINGKPVKSNKTDLMPKDPSAGSKMIIGKNAPGLYDELFIWNRVLSPDEIKFICNTPQQAAAQVKSASSKASAKDVDFKTMIPFKDITLYIPFDNSATPAKALGLKTVKSTGKNSYVSGIVNRAININGKKIDYTSTKNFDIKQGTLVLWVKLNHNFNMIKEPATLFRAGHFVLSIQPKRKLLFFMTGMHNGEYFRWDYSPQSNLVKGWKAGQWHQIAVVWDIKSRRKELYIDGQLISSAASSRMPDHVSPAGQLLIGDGLKGSMDELVCFSKPLAGWQIAALCASPGTVAEKLGIKVNKSVTNLKYQKKALKSVIASANAPNIKFDLKPIPVLKTIVSPGETFTAEIPVRNPSTRDYSDKVEFTLRDFWMNDSGKQTIDLKLKPGEARTLKIAFTPKLKGIYKIEAKFMVNGKDKIRDLSSFASYPPPPERDPDSFFGNHINAWSDGKYLAQGARLGQTWQRDHNMVQTTWWFKVQPNPGKFTWTYDFQLNYLKKYKMPLLGQLFTTPYWAAATPQPKPKKAGYNKCWAPNLKLLDKYVFETVSRYKDYIKYWEIWNEPAVNLFWKGSPEEFGQMVQVAVKAAKRADPNCVVMSAGYTCPAWVWHEKAAKAGAFKNLDAISFHYGCHMGPITESYAKLKSVIEHFNEMAIKYGDGHKLPMWSTEAGCGDTTFLRGIDNPQLPPEKEREPLNWRKGAIRTVQGEANLMSQHVQKHFIYLQNRVAASSAKAYLNNSMLDINNTPRPKLMARVIMQDQLDWTSFKTRVYRAKDGRFWANVHQKKRSSGSVVLLWCGDDGKLELSCKWPGKVSNIINIMGNSIKADPAKLSITGEPFYIHVDAKAEAVAKALESAQIKIIKAPEILVINDGPDKPKVPTLPDFVAPSENLSGNFTVDISKYCNMGFADDKPGNGKGGWSDEGPMNDMRDFKTGKRTFYGVKFNIIDPKTNNGKSVITMYGKSITPSMPKKVTIPINRKARVLYFLHAASWGSPGDIAEYVVNFADGTKKEVKINIPANCNNWWSGYDPKEESKPVPVKVTNTTTGKPAWRYLRVFELATDSKKVPIKSVELISAEGRQTPIIIAISGNGGF